MVEIEAVALSGFSIRAITTLAVAMTAHVIGAILGLDRNLHIALVHPVTPLSLHNNTLHGAGAALTTSPTSHNVPPFPKLGGDLRYILSHDSPRGPMATHANGTPRVPGGANRNPWGCFVITRASGLAPASSYV